jgi:hypothetical protein
MDQTDKLKSEVPEATIPQKTDEIIEEGTKAGEITTKADDSKN